MIPSINSGNSGRAIRASRGHPKSWTKRFHYFEQDFLRTAMLSIVGVDHGATVFRDPAVAHPRVLGAVGAYRIDPGPRETRPNPRHETFRVLRAPISPRPPPSFVRFVGFVVFFLYLNFCLCPCADPAIQSTPSHGKNPPRRTDEAVSLASAFSVANSFLVLSVRGPASSIGGIRVIDGFLRCPLPSFLPAPYSTTNSPQCPVQTELWDGTSRHQPQKSVWSWH